MIATNSQAVDVLRHGWQDAAGSLAGDVPEVADLLQARVEMAIATDQLDEKHLLESIEEIERIAARTSAATAEALARRLRRTVYEYLLALDAAQPLEIITGPVAPAANGRGSPLVGAEEIAALGHAARHDAALHAAEDEATALHQLGDGDAHTARRRFGLRRRRRDDDAGSATVDTSGTEDVEEPYPAEQHASESVLDAPEVTGSEAVPDPAPSAVTALPEPPVVDEPAPMEADSSSDAVAPSVPEPPDEAPTADAPDAEQARFEPVATADTPPAPVPDADMAEGPTDTLSLPSPGGEDGAEAPGAPSDLALDPAEAGPPVGGAEVVAEEPVGTGLAPEEAVDAEAVETVGDADAAPVSFVAPRAGFHIVDDDERFDPADPGPGSPAAAPAAPSDEVTPAEAEAEPVTAPSPASDFLAWPQVTPAPSAAVEPSSPVESALPLDAAIPAQPPPPAAPTVLERPDPPSDEDDQPRGWRVRDHRDTGRARGVSKELPRETEDDPFGTNPALADTRRRIEERLRRKRCDEAAALLQALAQDTGGRAVADLAMNAGDRCRALGKSNAALNCYLAAARSDPVYEEPLSRLADVCIDAQDTELAVTYLERIARLYRYRGDDREALRVFRRIATIAPYREDVLTLLMNAQRTGRLD